MSILTPQMVAQQEANALMQQACRAFEQLLSTKPESPKMLQEMVRLSGEALRAGGAGLWVTEVPDKPTMILEHNLANLQLLHNGAPLAGIGLAVRRTVREGKSLIVPPFFVDHQEQSVAVNPSALELLFVPMRLHGSVALVLMMAVPAVPEHSNFHRGQINFLQKMLGLVETTLSQQHMQLVEKDRGTSSKIVQFAEQVHKSLLVRPLATDIANLVRDVISAERGMVELYPRVGKKVLAVTHVDEPNKRASLLQAQSLILQYVRERNVPVILDRAAAGHLVSDPALQDAAQAYFAICPFNAFMAAPIRGQHDKVLGVILMEYADSSAAQKYSALLSDLARVAAGSVSNAIAYEAIPLRKPLHALAQFWLQATANKRRVYVAVTATLLVTLGVLALVPFDLAIKTDCALQPVAHLGIVAPMEGRIIEVPVRAGEHVYPTAPGKTVQPLLVFDTTELLSTRAEAQQKLGELQVQLKDVQDKGEIAKIGALQLQIKQVQDQLQLIAHQIQRATVYSPIEGTVLTENIQQRQWSSVKLGEPLLEVASFSDWNLMVDVPESEVATVRTALVAASEKARRLNQPDKGIEVDYIFYPWPDRKYALHAKGLATLLPASLMSKDKNVFRLQITVNPADLPPGIALSGVTGRAKIHVGSEPLLGQWTRGLQRLVKMTALF